MGQSYIVFDIETVALDWDSFSESQQEYLVRNAKNDEEIQKKKSEMALYPLTSQVVCLGLQFVIINDEAEQTNESNGTETTKEKTKNVESITKYAYATDNSLADAMKQANSLSDETKWEKAPEKIILTKFWDIIDKHKSSTLITFNGRNFDIPFLMLRSAILGIRPSKNLMAGTKYNYAGSSGHIDLIDELTFYNPSSYGATKRFNFDFYTRAFGITSPKSEGIDGSKVAELFREGRLEDITAYCMRDVHATWELFKVWNKYLRFT